jgi:tRNA1Val (adenine37-N6)-methyltransferase
VQEWPDALSQSPAEGETLDAICGGEIRILQGARGYRFNLDPLLLVDFAAVGGLGEPAIDLGTGTAIMPLILVRRYGLRRVTGIELQPRLYELARRNVRLNGCDGRIALALGDLRRLEGTFPRESFAHVLANPPYRRIHASQRSPHPERAIAMSEVACTLTDVVRAASHLLKLRGSLSLVVPAARLPEALTEMHARQLAPRRLRLVHSRPTRAAHLALLEGTKGGGAPLTVLPPLVLHEALGQGFTPEVQGLLS